MIDYRGSVAGIQPDQLQGFFEGWPKHPTPERHLALLQNSDYVVIAWDDETQRVVGFINAVSDRVLSAYIPLLEVLPAYRKRGIGGELVRRMLERLSHLYMVDLTCDADLQPFYERLGMQRYTSMMMRRFDRQDGQPAAAGD
ncbi:MAG: GNAT family N-acetyltransferase [candidate division Zixibacteria bacterium]|nr:GNAT family N-acetyltransferase [candidate division Zixibacteria bacterium]